MNSRAIVNIKGTVQGVFYRSSTETEANKLNLTGWVRNCPDGSVQALFEGDKTSIDQVIEWCRIGPQKARVSELNSRWEEYKNEFNTFSIKY